MPREVQQRRATTAAVNVSRLWMLPLLGLCLASFGLRCDARAVSSPSSRDIQLFARHISPTLGHTTTRNMPHIPLTHTHAHTETHSHTWQLATFKANCLTQATLESQSRLLHFERAQTKLCCTSLPPRAPVPRLPVLWCAVSKTFKDVAQRRIDKLSALARVNALCCCCCCCCIRAQAVSSDAYICSSWSPCSW